MKTLYDVIVIGGGPAGLTAALYLARARYSVLVVEKEKFGGQITITADVVNYPGVMQGSGTEITETMRRQAESFGAEFLLAEVTGLDMQGDLKTVHTSKGDVKAFGVLLATGAHPRKVGFKGEEEFKGRGVAYCATCDGEFFTGLDIFVVGGGFAAAEEAVEEEPPQAVRAAAAAATPVTFRKSRRVIIVLFPLYCSLLCTAARTAPFRAQP